jgi:phage terminase large subunit
MTGARELGERYAADPVAFAREVLGFEPWSRQAEILEAVRDHGRVAVKSCNASGKTAAASCAVLWWLAQGPGSVCVTTAPTERQVRKVLWREVAQRHRHARGFFRGATLTDAELYLAPDWFALGLTADNTESFQGIHAERLLVVVDEASGVDERIFEAVDALLAGGEARLLLISNPTRTSGAFYDAFSPEQAELWHTITISAFDCPAFTGEKVSRQASKRLVSRKFVETARQRWGEPSPLYAVRVLGDFPSLGEDSVVAVDALEAARRRTLEPGLPLVVSCDVARFGMDETVIATRMGDVVRIVKTYSGVNLMQTVGEIVRAARDLHRQHGRRPTVVVDDVGVGGGVTDRLREEKEFDVVPYNGGGRARHSSDYPNRRSEDWFGLSELLATIDLDDDHQVSADLLAARYTIDSQGRRVVEPKAETKRRLRRSPDRADAIIMAFSVDRPRGNRILAVLNPGRHHRIDERVAAPSIEDVIERAMLRRRPSLSDAEQREGIARAEREARQRGPRAPGYYWNGRQATKAPAAESLVKDDQDAPLAHAPSGVRPHEIENS